MYDKTLVTDILKNIFSSLQQILKRFRAIENSSDFIADDSGLEKLDSICMQLIAVGERVKYVEKVTRGGLLVRYPEVELSSNRQSEGERRFLEAS